MKILFEQYQYDESLIKKLLDSHYYSVRKSETKACIPYVGYYMPKGKNDPIFILPKVFIKNGLAFDKYLPEDIYDFNQLEEEDKKTIFALSTWIYRAIKLYYERKDKEQENDNEIMQNVVSHHGENNEMMIDIILSLLKFQLENQQLFTYITKLKHSGNNKVHWQKTISKTQPLFQNGRPIYTNPVTKNKDINFDEELVVLFYSVLNYLNEEFHFNIKPIFGYNLITPESIKDMIDSGKGVRMLRQNRRKYFTDKMVRLWNLLFTFFEQSQNVESKENENEQAMLVRDFNLVFEDMIDSLIGDDNLPKGLKEQKDGKIIDHIYKDESLIETTKDVYFIGDSKYYKEDNEIGQNSLYKQFTYAHNVIQYNIDLFNKEKKGTITQESYLPYRDDFTEGYNITPNFFIRGQITALNDYANDGISPTPEKTDISYHFENRLFDRDTLILQEYNINFLFVLAAYVQGAGEHKKHIRAIFRSNVQKVLQEKYKFFAIKPKDKILSERYLKEHFQDVLGKVYNAYDYDTTNCLSLALQNNKQEENQKILNAIDKYFYRHDIGDILDVDPRNLFGENEHTIISGAVKQTGVLMFAEGDKIRDNDIAASKIAIGFKSNEVGINVITQVSQIQYILFHYWKDPHLFELKQTPKLVSVADPIDDDYVIRQKDNAIFYLLCDFDPTKEITTIDYDIMKLQKKGLVRYLPFVTTIEELKNSKQLDND